MNHQNRYSHSRYSAYVYAQEISDASIESSTIYVVNLLTSQHLILKHSSAVIWELLNQPITLTQLVKDVAEIYQQNPTEVEPTIVEFLNEMNALEFLSKESN